MANYYFFHNSNLQREKKQKQMKENKKHLKLKRGLFERPNIMRTQEKALKTVLAPRLN